MSAPGSKPKIFTFYSYKGGTGRSMALANVAWMLALNNHRVLVIDWDLEAPGIHRYFHPFLEDKELQTSRGLIDLVEDLAARQAATVDLLADNEGDISSYVISLEREEWDWTRFGDRAGIDLLPAGQQTAAYSTKVNSFSWISFYTSLGGRRFLDFMAAQARQVYDYILIDSRTGVSDTSGICTVEMPDSVVVCFTLNEQNLRGAANVCESMMSQRKNIKENRGVEMISLLDDSFLIPDCFRIYPVATRIENSENKKKQIAMSLVKRIFSRYLVDMSAEDQSIYWGGLQMAYIPVYAFEEVPAVFGDSPDDQLSICPFVQRLAGTITREANLSLKALPEELRLKVLDWYQRTSETPEDAAQMAEAEFRQFTEGLQRKASQVLLRLVLITPTGLTPQPFNREDLQKGLSQAVDALVRLQILKPLGTEGGQAIHLVNPSILQTWSRYQDWVASDRKFLQWRQSVHTAARSWRLEGKRESDLFRGDSLEEAKRYLRDRTDDLNEQEREFLSESADREELQRQIEANSRARREELEKQLTLLESLIATKKEDGQLSKWYRSPAFQRVLALLLAAAALTTYLATKYREERTAAAQAKIATIQASNYENTLKQLQAQNLELEAQLNRKLASVSNPVRSPEQDPHQSARGKNDNGNLGASATTTPSALDCLILSTDVVWTLPGQIFISLDGKQVGYFSVSESGSTKLGFQCTPGQHKITMDFIRPGHFGASCMTGINVTSRDFNFLPSLLLTGGVATQCGLRSANLE